ncbi:RNA polymerase I [Sistotremastrum niveocremeum HHB9708]|uniref:DNA-directed RNA polymerases I, II, and III subunit RPABC3 n=2 Tax=Sistotremastraceae TaxID=3402574 RepID=A0A164U5S8_9AGAM|nr:RNA polymerase I [Sistotremastrum niveocremeum HHB9708]KZT44383.1 RNA polymerase [Sistotremastrum suecicum HHB10207 ss-3]
MTSVTSNVLFDDLFTVTDIDKEGKKYERVSRLSARSANFDMELSLDYNTELYTLHPEEKFTLVLASSLVRGGVVGPGGDGDEEGTDMDRDVWRPDGKGRRGLEEDYEYVMYGKVYKFDEGLEDAVTAYASFGGLLMTLTGSFRHMQGIVLGDPVYLLMRR